MLGVRDGMLALLTISMMYEPLRNALYRWDERVGGVGGVGGLTNQWPCDKHGEFGKEVCFHRGVFMGFTTFALVVLLLWTLPLAMTAGISYYFSQSRQGPQVSEMHSFRTVWIILEILWFTVPLAAYLSDAFYRTDVWHNILAVALAASFPLSWHLSLVAIPASRRVLAPLTGFSMSSIMTIYKNIAWSTVGWAMIHVIGELLYIWMKDRRTFRSGSSRFLYWAGALTASVLFIHSVIACYRTRLLSKKTFVSTHRIIALILLLSASIHWWPFVFFLSPAVAVFTTSRALEYIDNDSDLFAVGSLTLSASLFATICGISVGWYIRQLVLLGTNDQAQILPFGFPPLSLTLGYLFAYVAAQISVLYYTRRYKVSCTDANSTLLCSNNSFDGRHIQTQEDDV